MVSEHEKENKCLKHEIFLDKQLLLYRKFLYSNITVLIV